VGGSFSVLVFYLVVYNIRPGAKKYVPVFQSIVLIYTDSFLLLTATAALFSLYEKEP
jgi:hypothetical protein